jgi:hypothetical protein
MRCLRGWLSSGLLAVALVLCAGWGLVWVRSFYFVDQVVSGSGSWRWLIKMGRGTVQIGQSHSMVRAPPLRWTLWTFDLSKETGDDLIAARPWFFDWVRNGTGWALSIPLWFFLVLPLAQFLVDRVRRRPLREGLCATCGYDLRGTPERCPECGRVVGKAV